MRQNAARIAAQAADGFRDEEGFTTIGVVLALCVAIYTGCLLGVCQTYPLWNNALLPILFVVSALPSGAASVLMVAVVRHADEFIRVGVLKKFHFCLPIIELVLVASLCFITAQTGAAGNASIMSLVAGEWALWFWIGLVAIGLVLPTVLETWLLFFSPKEFEESRKAHWISFFSDAGVLVGESSIAAMIVGDYALMKEGCCKLSYFTDDVTLFTGDSVVTSGRGGAFPSGIIVGTVTELRSEAGGQSYYAVVKPSVDLSVLSQVFIIKDFEVIE